MPTITYSFLDNTMNQSDEIFFKQLGKRVSDLRKELGITQAQLAKTLAISQQLIACYESGSRKIPASLLPTLANMFAVPLEELIGMKQLPAKRGPASMLQRQVEQINGLPKAKQKMITEVIEALIKQQDSA